MIAVDSLTKLYYGKGWDPVRLRPIRKEIRALDGVSFDCRSGEILGIVGPNGAGKTTLLRLLSTLIQPTSGTAVVAGCDIAGDGLGVRQNIGFVSPTHGLYEHLSVSENLRLFALLNGVPAHEVDDIVADVVGWLGLGEYANTAYTKLSTGFKQRASIGRAVVHQPPVLLFDEPTNGLDDVSTRAVLDFIRDCRKEGQAVLFCSHILPQVAEVCDRIVVMARGRIVASGTQSQLLAHSGSSSLELAYQALTTPSDPAAVEVRA